MLALAFLLATFLFGALFSLLGDFLAFFDGRLTFFLGICC